MHTFFGCEVSRNILIAAPYSTLPGEGFVNRFAFLAQHFVRNGHKVTFATSAFSHIQKKKRTVDNNVLPENLDVILIDEPGYRSHVGWDRVYSIKIFSRNFKRTFADLSAYDLVYSAYPLISHNLHIASVVNPQKTRYVVDIQDVWPESFSSVIPAIGRLPPQLLPFARSANRVYSAADGIVAVSQTYLDRALKVNDACKSMVGYLGSEFDVAVTTPRRGNTINLFYIGTLSHSYDVKTVMAAVEVLASEGINLKFNVFGAGPQLDGLRNLGMNNTIFHGLCGYRELEQQLRTQHIAVNPIARGAPQSITNKLCDYFALGCPLLNSQEGFEVQALISDKVHANYRAGDVMSARDAISSLLKEKLMLSNWNSDERFIRKAIADKILSFVEGI